MNYINVFRFNTAFCFALITGVIVTAVGCDKKTDQSTKAEIKVGVILPLTGESAAYGVSARQGIELALSQYSKSTNSSPPISIIYEDDRADAKVGVNAFNKLADVDGTKVIIGAMASSITLAIAPIAERNHIVLISPTSSAPEISAAGDYIFRTAYSDEFEGSVLAGYAIKELGLKSFAILRSDNAYGKGLSEQFVRTTSELGGTILSSDKYSQGATEFRTQLLRIKSLQPSAVLIIGYKELSNVLIQAKQLGLTCQFLSSVMFEDPDIIRLANDAANGVIYTFPAFNTESTNASVNTFVSNYNTM